MTYSRGGQGRADVDAGKLIEANKRQRLHRSLLAELRGDEAMAFLVLVGSGHPGSITSIHADSAELALDQLTMLTMMSEVGGRLGIAFVERFISRIIHLVVHCEMCSDGKRRVTEIMPVRRAT